MTRKNFAPVTLVSVSPPLLLVHPSVPVKSVKELIALAKAQPGKLAYASVGIGSPQHFAGELLNLEAKIKMNHVPYKGAAPALIDLGGRARAGGHDCGGSGDPAHQDGPTAAAGGHRAQALAVAARCAGDFGNATRLRHRSVVRRVGAGRHAVGDREEAQRRIVAIVQAPDFRASMLEVATEVIGGTPEDLRKLQIAEIEKYKRIAQAANIKTD